VARIFNPISPPQAAPNPANSSSPSFKSIPLRPSCPPCRSPRPMHPKQTRGTAASSKPRSFANLSMSPPLALGKNTQSPLSKESHSDGDYKDRSTSELTLPNPSRNISSLNQRKLDQEWVDSFLRERGFSLESNAESSSEGGYVCYEKERGCDVERLKARELTPLEKEKRNRKKREWRRRRRLAQRRPQESGVDSCVDIATDAIRSTQDGIREELSGAASSEADASSNRSQSCPIQADMVQSDTSVPDKRDFPQVEKKRRKTRQELAELDKMVAKLAALEKLRELRKRDVDSCQPSHANDKNSLDALVADSVFDSKIENLGRWIEIRKQSLDGRL